MNKLLLNETAAPEKRVKRFSVITSDTEDGASNKKNSDLFLKKSFDIVISLLVAVFILSWLLPILAILIKINSKGPVFFVQKRVGALGKVFYCYKLRTMYVNGQANLKQARENDPRITSVGKFLRLSCLDEMPQFLNVLRGEMSIVGPRPHMLKDCHEFSNIVKQYNSREQMKPGITGMAQVKGYRGETTGFYDVFHRYKWDMFYVNNYNFLLDMRIIRLTIKCMVLSVIGVLNTGDEKSKVTYQLDTPEYLN